VVIFHVGVMTLEEFSLGHVDDARWRRRGSRGDGYRHGVVGEDEKRDEVGNLTEWRRWKIYRWAMAGEG